MRFRRKPGEEDLMPPPMPDVVWDASKGSAMPMRCNCGQWYWFWSQVQDVRPTLDGKLDIRWQMKIIHNTPAQSVATVQEMEALPERWGW